VKIQRFVVGRGVTNCYLVSCETTGEAILIDAHFREGEGEKILEIISVNSLNLKYLINTHGHFDHTNGNRLILDHTDAHLVFHKGDQSMISEPWARHTRNPTCPRCGAKTINLMISEDRRTAKLDCSNCNYTLNFKADTPIQLMDEGDLVIFGNQTLTVLHTPGHSRGGICLYNKPEKVLFSGDTLFRRSIGRTDFPGASHTDMQNSLRRLKQLPGETKVYPGHGDPTTIKEEQESLTYWIG